VDIPCPYGFFPVEGIMKGLVVIDMLNDFVTGPIGTPRAEAIVPQVQQLLEYARANPEEWKVFYANDSHLPDDPDVRLLGVHAMRGTSGADVIADLVPVESDSVLPKRFYSSFYGTDLEPLLRKYAVDTLVVTGLHTNVCCRHTTADAFFRGYKVIVPRDAVEALTEEEHLSGLKYLETIYGADLPYTKELIA
jgi:nicotinamidase-related amidase